MSITSFIRRITACSVIALAAGAGVLAVSGPASATIPLPPGGDAGKYSCTYNNTSQFGVPGVGGSGRPDKGTGKYTSTMTTHSDVVFTSCMTRKGSKVTMTITWKTPKHVTAATFNGYVVDCTTKKFTLVTRLAYANGTSKNTATKTSSATFKTKHKLQPVFDPEGYYLRNFKSAEGLKGWFGLYYGSRGTGVCV